MRLRVIRRMLLLFVSLVCGCSNDHSQPTTPSASTVTILVDRNNPNAVAAPCGSTDAVCASITDGLRSAEQVRDGIPTIVVKPGIYDAEPAYPIKITFPVILKSDTAMLTNYAISGETPPVTLMIPAETDGMLIMSNDVTIEGLLFDYGGSTRHPTAIQVADRGHLTMRSTQIRLRSGRGYTLEIKKNSHATIEQSILGETVIDSAGHLTIRDSAVQGSEISISGGSLVLHRNTIEATITEWDSSYDGDGITVQTEIAYNTIFGRMLLTDGKILLKGNSIPSNDSFCTSGIGCTSKRDSNILINIVTSRIPAVQVWAFKKSTQATFTDNMIKGSLGLMGPLSATLVSNRVGTVSCGYDPERGEPNIRTDGRNMLLDSTISLDCNGLPSEPGTNAF